MDAKRKFFYRRTRLMSSETAVLDLLFLFVAPIVLLYFHIIPDTWRVFVLMLVSVMLYGIMHKEGWTAKDLGLTTSFKKRELETYVFATILALAVTVILAYVFNFHGTAHWWTKPHFLFLFLVVSFFQEFAFRGFLIPLLSRVFPDVFTVIVVNALLFAGMHAIYSFPAFGLPYAFLGGLLFAGLYYKYPNLILVTISHSVLNFVAVWFGVFAVTR